MTKKNLLKILLCLLPFTAMAQQAKHVILVCIDGFRPEFYLDSPWHTPHLKALVKQGTYAKAVNSVFPSMMYPALTTIVTGVQPEAHGVYYNTVFDPTGSTDKPYWADTSIHAPTLWKALRDKGLKTGALLWPATMGAPIDYNIPEIGNSMIGDEFRDYFSSPRGIISVLKKSLFNGANKIDYGKDQNVGRIAAATIVRAKPAFMAVRLSSVDDAQHADGRNGDMVKYAIADADESIGMIQDAIKKAGMEDSTVLIVTGGYGFVDVKKTIYPNVWLQQAGLYSNIKTNDWKAQFFSVGGSASLYLKDTADKATLQKVQELLAALPAETKAMFRIISPADIQKAGANPTVAFALSGENNTSFADDGKGDAVRARETKGAAHGYYPGFKEISTGFIISGTGIKSNGVIDEMGLIDIAPVIARILEVPFPTAKGKIPTGIF